MQYNGPFITIFAICIIIYSFYHYNKDSSSLESTSNTNGARYHVIIDPERTDLSWYEKLIIKYAKKKNKKLQKKAQPSSDANTDKENFDIDLDIDKQKEDDEVLVNDEDEESDMQMN